MNSDLNNIVGSTILAVEGCEVGSTKVIFRTSKGDLTLSFKKDYFTNCRVYVSVEDITGDPADLVDGVVSVAEQRSNKQEWEGNGNKKETRWTFYTIRTTKGDLDLRWYGHSNGHYSTSVNTDWTEKVEETEEERELREAEREAEEEYMRWIQEQLRKRLNR